MAGDKQWVMAVIDKTPYLVLDGDTGKALAVRKDVHVAKSCMTELYPDWTRIKINQDPLGTEYFETWQPADDHLHGMGGPTPRNGDVQSRSS